MISALRGRRPNRPYRPGKGGSLAACRPPRPGRIPRRVTRTRGLASSEVYGVEVYNDSAFETLYHYGRGKAQIEWDTKRLLAYYVRPYVIRADGSYVRLAAYETDRYDVGGAVGVRTSTAHTSSAPCDPWVKFGRGIRWNDGSFGKRGAWSDIFTNYDNPNCA